MHAESLLDPRRMRTVEEDRNETMGTDGRRQTEPIGRRTFRALRREPVDLGVRETFADIGATIAEVLRVSAGGLAGTSFAKDLGL